MTDFTTDTFYNGRIRIKQHKSGYRFSIDAVLLACHIKPCCGDKIVDLGTGCAIIPLMLAYNNPEVKIYGVEIQKELADVAVFNVKNNNMEKQITILCSDMKDLKHDMISGPVDLVVTNPPYWKIKSGRLNPNSQRAIARHEIKATLCNVIETAGRILRSSGKFIAIYPANRLVDILIQMHSCHIEPKFLRVIHSNKHTEAKLILVEGVKNSGSGVKIAPPLMIYRKDGCSNYTKELNDSLMSG